MFKAVLLGMILTLSFATSFAAHAKSAKETVEGIERNKDARCEYKKSTNNYCFNYTCYRWKEYMCTPNNVTERAFKLRLRVRKIEGDEETVTNVTFF